MQNAQGVQENCPVWLKAQYMIDVKYIKEKQCEKKQCEWKVCFVINVAKGHVGVRYDGYSSNSDQSFPINSSKLKPFRSFTRGYTGPIEAIRDHYTFSIDGLRQNYLKPLIDFTRNIYAKSEFQITQFIRGKNYTWIDFMMTHKYKDSKQVAVFYQYFQNHFNLTLKYLQDMLKCKNFEDWFNGNYKAFAECYFQIFDSVHTILDCNQRFKSFFLDNQTIFMHFKNKHCHIPFITDYLNKIQFMKVVDQLIQRLLTQKWKISINFLYGFMKLVFGLEKTLQQKESRKKLTNRICQIVLKQLSNLSQYSIKQQQQLQDIDKMCKMLLNKHDFNIQILPKFEIININIWKCLIMSEKLQKKIKGISNLLQYYRKLMKESQLVFSTKESLEVFSTKESINNEIRKKQIINAIFYENDHHEIIKKGCDLMQQLYKGNAIGSQELGIVWKSCRHRLDAVRKVMYTFFQTICKDFKFSDLQFFVNLLIQEEMVKEVQKNFYYTFFKNVLGWAQKDKIPILQQLFAFSYGRIFRHLDEVKLFVELITMQKSQIFGFLSKYAQLIINEIVKDEQNINYVNLLNSMYEQSTKKQLKIQRNAFSKILNKLYKILQTPIKNYHREKENQIKKQRIKQLLYLLENMSISQFQLSNKTFLELWKLFNEKGNQEMKETVFLRWILHVSVVGKQEVTTINKCIKQKIELKQYIFNEILKSDKKLIHYQSISQMQLKLFERFMIQVNSNKLRRLHEITYKFPKITYFRINESCSELDGLNELWLIFQSCVRADEIKRVVKMILNCYTNYQNDVSDEIKCKKIQELLNHIDQGICKGNQILVKNSLYMLYQLIILIKQIITDNQIFNNNNNVKQSNKNIKIQRNQNWQQQFKINVAQTIKVMKKKIADHFNIKPYQLQLFKKVVQNIEDHEQHEYSSSDVSVSSNHTEFNLKQKEKITRYRSVSQQQIPKQLYSVQIFLLITDSNECRIVIKEKRNAIYQKMNEYISSKLQKKLLQILQQQSKQLSQLTYLILIQIPSNMNPQQILNNSIQKISSKSNKPQTNSMVSISLHEQNIHFRMYFYKNVNLLRDDKFEQLINEKSSEFDGVISKQISRKIKENIEIQLLLQVMRIIRRSIAKNTQNRIKCTQDQILECVTNFLSYMIQSRNKKYNQQSFTKLFQQCFLTLQVILKKKQDKIIDCIVQYHNFQNIMYLLYENMLNSKYAEIFAHKLQQYFQQQQQKISQKTEQILWDVIFNKLYEKVINNKSKKYLSLFIIIKQIIQRGSNLTIQKLFYQEISNLKRTFWDNCIKVIQNQNDFYLQEDKQNYLLSNHLTILQKLIKKKTIKVDEGLWKMVFYNCLYYSEQYTGKNDAKCFSLGSIKAGLSLLFAICKISQKCLMQTIKQLRKLQMGKDWRTSEQSVQNSNVNEKSPCGFVGLENPGCICYLNSFIQTLFMNEQFRNRVINFSQLIEGQDYSLLIEMRKLFLNLQHSQQKYIDPVPFSKTVKNNQGKPLIKIYQQMDIEQYSSILFDKIQKLLPKGQDFVKQIFQGTYSNDIISKQCKHSSQRKQNFLSMQLDVKSTLQDSLKILVNTEVLEGQNAYFCQKCDRKVKAIKRMSIKKLPNYLIICLKRFEYNFQRGQKIKVNAFCEFPKQITFEQYSQQLLNSLETQQPVSSEKGEEIQSETPVLPHEYFQFKLKGVIIHSGFADNGHYYTLIQVDSQSGKKWVEFNDYSVAQFDISKLPEQAFGGDDPKNYKQKNAYMLVYERKKKMEQQQEMQQISTKQNQQKVQQCSGASSPQNYSSQAQKLYKQIILHNKQMRIFRMMLTHEYRSFIKLMIVHVFNKHVENRQQSQMTNHNDIQTKYNNLGNDQQNQKGYSDLTIQEVIKFYLEHCIFIKSKEAQQDSSLIQSLAQIQNYLSKEVGLPIIDYFIHQLSQELMIYELFISITAKQNLKRIVISHFIWNVIAIRLVNISQKQKNGFFILIFRFIETLLTTIISNGVCINQAFYIMRKLSQNNRDFALFLFKINVFQNAFQILVNANKIDECKNIKIQEVHSQVDQYVYKFGNNGIKIDDGKNYHRHLQMKEESQERYEMKTVKKIGKQKIKNLSLQQVWNYLYYELKSSQDYGEQDNIKQAMRKRKQNLEGKLLQLKQDKISHFLLECQGGKAANSICIFLCKVAHGNTKIFQKLCLVIQKAFKNYQAIKMRHYLILLYHLVMNCQSQFKRVIQTLQNALTQNAKYFSEMDILSQWIMKLILVSKKLKQFIINTNEGTKLCNEIQASKRLQIEFVQKLKNSIEERYKYLLNGLRVSSDIQQYQNIYQQKKQFFETLLEQQYLPSQYYNIKKIQSYLQPTYEELTREIKIGDKMNYLFKKKLILVVVKGYKYGVLKVHKIVQDNDGGQRNSMIQESKLDEEEEIILENIQETDQKLKVISKLQKFNQSETAESYKQKQNMEDQHWS